MIFTKAEKHQLILDMTEDLRQRMLSKLDHVPENWEWMELHQWMYDLIGNSHMDRRRKRNYNNDIMISCNLL